MKSVGSKLRYISINCEYVATGTRHDERTVCMVTVVNRKEKIIFSKKIKPEQPIISYLTPLTGLTKKDFTQVEDLTTVMSTVRTLLGPDVILIGQKVSTDINRLGLKKGSNYLSHVDLVDIFKYFHPHYNTYTVFSLYHQANILLSPSECIILYTYIYRANTFSDVIFRHCQGHFLHRNSHLRSRVYSQLPL